MTPLAVDPGALDRAGADLLSAGDSLGWVVSTLTLALSGCAGMAGDDPGGARLGRSYDGSAAKLVEAMVVTRSGLCNLGTGVRMSAHNYSLAEAGSDIGGQSKSLPAPPPIEPLVVGSPPSSVGSGSDAPPGWGWVDPFIGMIWPTGDSAKLRTAAAAWVAAGTKFGLAEFQGTAGAMEAVRTQQIPEGTAIEAAISDAYGSTTGIVDQCQQIAAQLTNYAAELDKVHAAILDLLARICDPLTGIKEVWDVLTDNDEDEIKKIADDIRTVVDNFTAEADALRSQLAAVLERATTVITAMGEYAVKHWDPFSHAVGRAMNQLGQRFKGIAEEAGGTLKGLWEVSQVRAVVDPVGWSNSMNEVSKGIAPLVGAAGEHGPAVSQAWRQLGDDLTHWDDWKTNPLEAYGKSEFDLATMFLPGGSVSKLGKMGTAARDAVGLRKPPMLEPLAPRHVVPPDAAPREPAPQRLPGEARPAPAPVGTTPPRGPTEAKAPLPHGSEVGPTPRSKDASHPPPAPEPAAERPPLYGEPGGHPAVEIPGTPPWLTISGHGAYDPADAYMTVPRATTITLYAVHGSTITDDLGNLIEAGGDTSGVYSHIFHSGEKVPNYTIYPPDDLNVVGTPLTVTNPTLLSELIETNMGDVRLATCPFDETRPTDLVYDVSGIFDESTGIFTPYGGIDIDDG